MASINNTIEVVNAALNLPIVSLTPCKRIPKLATLAFSTSSGIAVLFTDMCTYVVDDNGLYLALYDSQSMAAMCLTEAYG